MQATDADLSNTVNSQIVYEIVPSMYSDNFTIDPNTGVLRNRGELDREALDPKLNGRIELNVTATDMGTPPLSTMVTVIINIEVSLQQLVANYWCCVPTDAATPREDNNSFLLMQDVNDNIPQFNALSYTFSVKEGEKGQYLFLQSTFKCS